VARQLGSVAEHLVEGGQGFAFGGGVLTIPRLLGEVRGGAGPQGGMQVALLVAPLHPLVPLPQGGQRVSRFCRMTG
jgi:hypothetical protein